MSNGNLLQGSSTATGLFERLPDTLFRPLASQNRQLYWDLLVHLGHIWRFYRANLVRAESDLMDVDPIQPPENRFYVDALFGKSVRQMIEEPDEDRYRVYSLSERARKSPNRSAGRSRTRRSGANYPQHHGLIS